MHWRSSSVNIRPKRNVSTKGRGRVGGDSHRQQRHYQCRRPLQQATWAGPQAGARAGPARVRSSSRDAAALGLPTRWLGQQSSRRGLRPSLQAQDTSLLGSLQSTMGFPGPADPQARARDSGGHRSQPLWLPSAPRAAARPPGQSQAPRPRLLPPSLAAALPCLPSRRSVGSGAASLPRQ